MEVERTAIVGRPFISGKPDGVAGPSVGGIILDQDKVGRTVFRLNPERVVTGADINGYILRHIRAGVAEDKIYRLIISRLRGCQRLRGRVPAEPVAGSALAGLAVERHLAPVESGAWSPLCRQL